MEVEAAEVLALAQARIGELEMEALTLRAALDQKVAELNEAKSALAAIEAYRTEQDAKVVPPDGWGSTGQALRSPLD